MTLPFSAKKKRKGANRFPDREGKKKNENRLLKGEGKKKSYS